MPPARPLNPITRMENAMLLIITRRIPAVITGGCAAGLAVCGALVNYEGAKTMAPGEIVAVFAYAAVIAEGVKLLWLSGFRYALQRREWMLALAMLCAGILLHTYSMVAALGTAASGRDKVISQRAGQQNALGYAQASAASAQAEAGRMAGIRSGVQVQEDVDRLLLAPDTNGCKSPRGKDAKVTCQQVQALRAELASARKADEARQNLSAAQAKLEALTLQAPQARDPQAEALASYLPLSAERIGKMLPLLPSLLIEFIPVAAMLLAAVLWSSAGATPAAVTADELPAGMSKEKEILQRVTVLVLNSQNGRLVTPSARRLANYLEVKPSTFAEWVDKWREKGLLKAVRQGSETIFMLPNYSTDKDS
jgi:hypothetical protein